MERLRRQREEGFGGRGWEDAAEESRRVGGLGAKTPTLVASVSLPSFHALSPLGPRLCHGGDVASPAAESRQL